MRFYEVNYIISVSLLKSFDTVDFYLNIVLPSKCLFSRQTLIIWLFIALFVILLLVIPVLFIPAFVQTQEKQDMPNENIAAENTVSGQGTVDDQKKKIISMAVKVDENIANDFRKLAKETGMEQGSFLKAMIENFRLNEDKTLYKEHAEDIQLMRDLTATINYKYVALIAQNRIEAEKARAKDEKKICPKGNQSSAKK